MNSEKGYIVGITCDRKRGIARLSTHHSLDYERIKYLWAEVEAYWNGDRMGLKQTMFC